MEELVYTLSDPSHSPTAYTYSRFARCALARGLRTCLLFFYNASQHQNLHAIGLDHIFFFHETVGWISWNMKERRKGRVAQAKAATIFNVVGSWLWLLAAGPGGGRMGLSILRVAGATSGCPRIGGEEGKGRSWVGTLFSFFSELLLLAACSFLYACIGG